MERGTAAEPTTPALPALNSPGLAIDTVRLRSPPILSELVKRVRSKLDVISRISSESGEVRWEIVTGSLKSSHDSAVSVRIVDRPVGSQLVLEGSVHKLALGHNVLGNPDGFQVRARELFDFVSKALESELPPVSAWEVLRVDVALLFDLGSAKAVGEVFRGLRGCVYPRRKVSMYGLESLYAPGAVTSVKLYHKGPEFKNNGREWRKTVVPAYSSFVREAADRRLRVEVEIKARRLMRLPGVKALRRLPLVDELEDAALEAVFDAEIGRLLREPKNNFGTVRLQGEVHERLRAMYSPSQADNLYGFWSLLASEGEDSIRRKVARSSYFRKRRLLEDAGISWHRTDAADTSGRPEPLAGLSMRRNDPRRCAETIEAVLAIAAAFAAGRAVAMPCPVGG